MIKIDTSNFSRLIGVWKTTGQISTKSQPLDLSGTDSYELILDGHYILHKADVMMGNDKSETFEMISLTSIPDHAQMQYFNSKGENGIMIGEISDNDFRIKGDGIKFDGVVNDKNSEIVGNWFLQEEDGSWTKFIDLKLEKQN